MKKSEKNIQEQEAIIAEYLLGDTTYRKLGAKHGVDFRVIHHWVDQGICIRDHVKPFPFNLANG